jgi:hypothetical protein
MSNLTKDQRLLSSDRKLFDIRTVHWRYQRTGQTSFFLYDCYIPIMLISICWIGALVGHILKTRYNYNFVSI